MKKKPIPEPKPEPKPEPRPYALAVSGEVGNETKPLFAVIAAKIGDVLSGSEFDFLRLSTVRPSHEDIKDVMSRHDGGAFLCGRGVAVNIDGVTRIMCGRGYLIVAKFHDIDAPEPVEIAEECKTLIDGITINAYGCGVPFTCGEISATCGNVHGRSFMVCQMPIKFGFQMYLKPAFRKMGEDKPQCRELVETWEDLNNFDAYGEYYY